MGRFDVVKMLLRNVNVNDTILNNNKKQAYELCTSPEIYHYMTGNYFLCFYSIY